MNPDDDYQAIEAIYDALDRGEPERALELIGSDPHEPEDEPVLAFLTGVALLELDRLEEAERSLARAVALDPADAEFRARLAVCRYHLCRLDEAAADARAAIDADDKLADGHEALGLVLETEGRFEEADRHFRRAGELEPDAFPAPNRMSVEEFERRVADAGDRLPDEFRDRLGQVATTVEPVPPRELLTAENPPLDPAVLGLFVGVALPDESHFATASLPPRIYLFQRNLERHATDPDDLEQQIAITLYHELGHYLGLDEEELVDIDLG